MEDAGGRLVDHLLEVRSQAEARFAVDSRSGLFMALSGLTTDSDSVAISDILSIQRLAAPPELTASEGTILARPTHQLACSEVNFDEHRWSLDGIFWTLSALLRLRCGGAIVPCEVAEVPWDVIDGCPTGRDVRQFTTGSVRRDWWPTQGVHVSASDGRWLGEHLPTVLALRADKTFHFGLECFYSAFDEQDVRMAVTKAWAGIEGLFKISAELRFRIALLVATVSFPPGGSRLAKFSETTALYDQRSRVVHGAMIPEAKVQKCALDSLRVLGDLLLDAIAHGAVRSTSELEAALLGA